MKEIIFTPLKGINIDDNFNIKLGETKENVRLMLGLPEDEIDNQLYYFNSEIRIDFDKYNKVEFIECLCNDNIRPIIYDKEALNLKDNELISLLKYNNNNKIDNNESDFSYYFYDISVGIYRDSSPSDIREMINEMKLDKTYENNKDDMEVEYEKSKYFNTIGIGVKNYYR